MKSCFYYIRDDMGFGERHATVCLLEDAGVYSRGIAFCSERDRFNKSLGRTIAESRAKTAMITETSGSVIRNYSKLHKKVVKFLKDEEIVYKCEFSPALTVYETGLLRKCSKQKNLEKQESLPLTF